MRGQVITQRRLQSGSARSLEAKDIRRKNVNGSKAAAAIPHQIIRTTEQELGQGPSRERGANRVGETLKQNKDGKGHDVISEYKSGQRERENFRGIRGDSERENEEQIKGTFRVPMERRKREESSEIR